MSPAHPWPSGLSAPFGYASHRSPAPAGPRLQKAKLSPDPQTPAASRFRTHVTPQPRSAKAERYLLPPDHPPLPEKGTYGSLLPTRKLVEPFSLRRAYIVPCVDPTTLH